MTSQPSSPHGERQSSPSGGQAQRTHVGSWTAPAWAPEWSITTLDAIRHALLTITFYPCSGGCPTWRQRFLLRREIRTAARSPEGWVQDWESNQVFPAGGHRAVHFGITPDAMARYPHGSPAKSPNGHQVRPTLRPTVHPSCSNPRTLWPMRDGKAPPPDGERSRTCRWLPCSWLT